MIKLEHLYTRLSFSVRSGLVSLLTDDQTADKLQDFLNKDLPEYQEENEELAQTMGNKELMLAIGKHLLEKYEDYKQHKKLQELSKHHMNTDQSKIKATQLKSDNCFQIKEVTMCPGLGFFYALEAIARKESFKISVPESIVIGFMHMQTTKIWTDKLGVLRCRQVDWEELPAEIERINCKNYSQLFPCSVLKYEMFGAEGIKVKAETLLFKSHETQDIMWKVQYLNHNNAYVVFQEFIRPKTSTASKVRVLFNNKIEKVFRVNNPKLIKQKKQNFTKVKKGKVIHLTWNESSISCENLDYYKHTTEICDFFMELIPFIDLNKENFYKLSEFLEKKKFKSIKKLEVLGNYNFYRRSSKLILTHQTRSKLLRNFTATLSESYTLVYPVTNFTSLDQIPSFFQEIIKSCNSFLPITQKISELVVDFLEDTKGQTYLHKIQKISCKEKLISQVPLFKPFRHISLYSATEGSSVTKGKRQQVCCGDYCNILKRNDLKTSEKIELLIKAKPEFSNGLFQLLKIQNFLNLDSAQSLFNKGNRIATPLTQNMQYKTIRRTILEDRNDSNSLKSIVSALPDDIIQELGLNKIKSSENEASQIHHINKKLSWEFELVPVCAMCYKIYGLKDTQSQKINLNPNRNLTSSKDWKVNETKFELKKVKKVHKSYVDFKKMMGSLKDINYPKFIKDKILNSSYVKVKRGLDEVKEFVPAKPVVHQWASATKISSNIINEVVEKFERFQKNIKKSVSDGNFRTLTKMG